MIQSFRRIFAAFKAILSSEPAEDFGAVFVVVLLVCGYGYAAYHGLASGTAFGFAVGFALPTATILATTYAIWRQV